MYGNAMAGLDAWLEAPYTNAAREEEAFEAFCEANDVDPEAEDAWQRFEDWKQDSEEDQAERRAEERQEWLEASAREHEAEGW